MPDWQEGRRGGAGRPYLCSRLGNTIGSALVYSQFQVWICLLTLGTHCSLLGFTIRWIRPPTFGGTLRERGATPEP